MHYQSPRAMVQDQSLSYGDVQIGETFTAGPWQYEIVSANDPAANMATESGIALRALPDASGKIYSSQLGWNEGQNIHDGLQTLAEAPTLQDLHLVIDSHYTISGSTIDLPDGLTMEGTETSSLSLTGIGNNSFVQFSMGADTTLTGMDFDAVGPGNLHQGVRLFEAREVDNIEIIDSHFEGNIGIFVDLHDVSDFKADHVIFDGGFYQVRWAGAVDNPVVSNSAFINSGADGIKTIQGTGAGTTNAKVSNSLFYNNERDGIDTTGGFKDSVVESSIFIDNGTAGIDIKTVFDDPSDFDQDQMNKNIEIKDSEFINNRIVFTTLDRLATNGHPPMTAAQAEAWAVQDVMIRDSTFEDTSSPWQSHAFLIKDAHSISWENLTLVGNMGEMKVAPVYGWGMPFDIHQGAVVQADARGVSYQEQLMADFWAAMESGAATADPGPESEEGSAEELVADGPTPDSAPEPQAPDAVEPVAENTPIIAEEAPPQPIAETETPAEEIVEPIDPDPVPTVPQTGLPTEGNADLVEPELAPAPIVAEPEPPLEEDVDVVEPEPIDAALEPPIEDATDMSAPDAPTDDVTVVVSPEPAADNQPINEPEPDQSASLNDPISPANNGPETPAPEDPAEPTHLVEWGDAGDDRANYFSQDTGVMFNGAGGNDYVVGSKLNDVFSGDDGRDEFKGGDGDDFALGGDGRDFLMGGNGDDAQFGQSGQDFLRGEDGNDFIHGGTDNDYLWGGKGDDFLYGGSGADIIWGGDGADTYFFTSVRQSSPDDVRDFQDVDVIALDALTFAALGETIDTNELQLGRTADGDHATLLYDERSRHLSYDEDGSGDLEAVVLAKLNLNGLRDLSHEHFEVIDPMASTWITEFSEAAGLVPPGGDTSSDVATLAIAPPPVNVVADGNQDIPLLDLIPSLETALEDSPEQEDDADDVMEFL